MAGYTVKFENGKTAQFQNYPTGEDIDYVAKQLGIGKPISAPPTPRGPGESGLSSFFPSLPETFQDIKSTAQNVGKTISDTGKNIDAAFQATAQGQQNPFRSAGQAIGLGLGGATKAAGQVIEGAGKVALPQIAEDAIKGVGGAVASGVANVATKVPFMNTLMENYQALDPKKKRDVDALLGVANFATTIAGSAGSAKPLEVVGGKAESALENLPTKAGNMFKGKSLDEVLAMPESKVYKLSKSERAAYFSDARDRIDAVAASLDKKAKEELAQKTISFQSEADKLQRQLAVASRDETIALRPKVIKAMGEQSKIYRSMVDEALAPHANVPVSGTELKQYVDSRFADNPDMASAINSRLGLGEKTVSAPLEPGELPTITDQGKDIPFGGKFNESKADTTIGKIYNQAQSLKQDIGVAAKKSSRTFTPDEKLTDDAISTLTDFLDSKGVDLSEPRKFWARYAPIRNQMVGEIKPFVQAPVQTKTFASTLSRVAKGTDVNNENFIKEVEKLVGEPIGNDTKAIVTKLDQNEKAQLAAKVEAETKKADAELMRDKLKKGLSEQEFEANRKARYRLIIKGVLATAATAGVATASAKAVQAAIGGPQ